MNEIELIEKIVNAMYERECEMQESYEFYHHRHAAYFDEIIGESIEGFCERVFPEYILKFDGGKWFVVNKI
ncbi:MAG: hypothetical protein KF900_14060 [Bacteroidetes bacterium]|nr:hypothetical protein [Bacteroidota bacterium]